MPSASPSSLQAATGRRTRPGLRGRQTDPAALNELETLLAGARRDRDELIEHLHALQDRFGHLSLRHLRALADWMNLPMAEVYETATFYAHFDVVREGEPAPPALTVRVCDSLPCQLAGAQALRAALDAELDPAHIRVLRAPCMGRCDEAPVVQLGRRHLTRATPATVGAALAHGELEGEVHHRVPVDLGRDLQVAREQDLHVVRATGRGAEHLEVEAEAVAELEPARVHVEQARQRDQQVLGLAQNGRDDQRHQGHQPDAELQRSLVHRSTPFCWRISIELRFSADHIRWNGSWFIQSRIS